MGDIVKIITQGGPHAMAILSILALIVLWRYHIKQMKNSTKRHRERDNKFEELQKENIACISKNNTLLELLVKGESDA